MRARSEWPTGRRSDCWSARARSVGSCDRGARVTKRPIQPVPRLMLTRREAAAALGMSLNHFARHVQPELKVVLSGRLVLIPISELERWVQRHARHLVELPAFAAG